MDLFLVPDNPEHTTLVSTNGVAHYQVNTSKSRHGGRRRTRIQRPAESHEASIVAEVDWGTWDAPTVVRSSLLSVNGRGCILRVPAPGALGKGMGVLATDFLYKKSQFSSSRYFIGDDAKEYRWKAVKGVGIVLCNSQTNEEVARYTCTLTSEGLYAGERKSRLRIQPCSVDIDMIVLSFLIMEKKRREKAGEGSAMMIYYDEDPKGDGGADVDGGGS